MTALAMPELAAAPPAAAEIAVLVQGVSRTYGRSERAVTALADVSITVRRGEFVCVVGPSGCGKSTLLALLAGLDRPDAGTVAVADTRPALMFQQDALFPWLTVEENVAFPLHMRHAAKAERRRRVAALLALVHLDGVADRRPHELSGGMRQRVALARALAQETSVLLMDEPFAALDALIRDRLHDELERVWRETGLTIVFVTHDIREAVRLGDRVLLLSPRPGRLAAEFAVAIARPRRGDAPAVAALAGAITDRLRGEVSSHASA